MECALIHYEIGQVVYAKLKGYPPWPALITHFPRNGMARVLYFNSPSWSDLSLNKLTPFHAGKHIEERYLRRNKAFSKAFDEMMVVLTIAGGEQQKIKPKNPKKNEPKPQILLHRLSEEDIKKIKLDLKFNGRSKKKLRNGRCY